MNDENGLEQKSISSWANTNFSKSFVAYPKTEEEVISIIQKVKQEGKKVIGRGAGRSYGDESLNDNGTVVDMSRMDQVIEWDRNSGLLRLQAGVYYDQVLRLCLKDGWTLAVIPGTRFVTMGGALANNVHGKNSYVYGNFGQWVREFSLVTSSGEKYICSDKLNNDLFFSVIGGAGLLGIVTEMTIQLVKIPSSYLSIKKITAPSLDEIMNNLDEVYKKNDFAIAQIDCFPHKIGLGRGTIHGASFIEVNNRNEDVEIMRNISKTMFGIVPKGWIPLIGKYFLNDYTMKWVSRLKYYVDKMTSSKEPYVDDIYHFTFLLDMVPNWKDVFKNGFFEYEPLIPKNKAKEVIRELIVLSQQFSMPAYLSAIKIHRKDNFLISYSMDGYSFAMDIPRRPNEKERQDSLFRKMNEIVLNAGGIVYLAKDANLTKDEFKRMYINLEQFMTIKKKYDPDGLFQSDMYKRLFI